MIEAVNQTMAGTSHDTTQYTAGLLWQITFREGASQLLLFGKGAVVKRGVEETEHV